MKIKDFFKRIYDLRLIKTKIQPQKNSSNLNKYSSAFERGRSMIEMLGVLVIMGLLAVGGIWGYQYAMNTYRAGQIQDVMAQAKALTVSRRTASEEALLTFLDKTAVAGFNPTVGIAETADANGRIQRVYTITLDLLNEGIQPILYARKPNFAKMDIMLAPSADAVEETDQSKESWVDAGMSEGGYDILQQYATLQSSSLAMFSFTTHLRGHMVSDGGGDDPSAQCPADKPFYDEETDSCYRCDKSINEYWNPTQMKCIACDGAKNVWDNVLYECVCPKSTPIWNESAGTCEVCIEDSQCPSNQICSGGKCICPGLKDWDETEGKCICKYVPEGGSDETCECPSGQDDLDGVCVTACPTNTGFTGKRNADKICTCDTTAGYAEIPVDNGTRCACDESRNYYDKPDGTCMQCERTTVEWCKKRGYDTSFSWLVDCENSMDEDAWYCGYSKYLEGESDRRFYNPSSNQFCGYRQVLKKNSNGQFYCSSCSTIAANDWGFCGCVYGRKWKDGKCTDACTPNTLIPINGKCGINPNHWTFDNKTIAGGTSCNGVTAWSAGSQNFIYNYWLSNTPTSCHPNAYDGVSGRYPQTDGGECDYRKGCKYAQSNLPACAVGSKITEDCTCGTGGSTGEYCCATTAYPTSGGCVTCSGNTVPNENKNGCETCPANTIVQNGKCVSCTDNSIPSANQLRCYPCPDGKIVDDTGTACVSVSDYFD